MIHAKSVADNHINPKEHFEQTTKPKRNFKQTTTCTKEGDEHIVYICVCGDHLRQSHMVEAMSKLSFEASTYGYVDHILSFT